MRLPKNFFEKDTLNLARNLLGKVLRVKQGSKILKGVIIETEAYLGEDDLASHASKGRTKRTETMYGKAGTVYVYMIYGMHHCLNIVTEKENCPAAVLIRGVMALSEKKISEGGDNGKINGPGRVCRYFGIDRRLNGENVFGKKIWLDDSRIKIRKKDIIASKRIGVGYAKHCKDYFWRFYLAGGVLK